MPNVYLAWACAQRQLPFFPLWHQCCLELQEEPSVPTINFRHSHNIPLASAIDWQWHWGWWSLRPNLNRHLFKTFLLPTKQFTCAGSFLFTFLPPQLFQLNAETPCVVCNACLHKNMLDGVTLNQFEKNEKTQSIALVFILPLNTFIWINSMDVLLCAFEITTWKPPRPSSELN